MAEERGNVTDAAKPTMRQGSVAVIDALGFKEARKLHPLPDLVATIARAQANADSHAGMVGLFGGSPTEIAAFSDTLILANLPQEEDWESPRRLRKVTTGQTVYNVASVASFVMVKAAASAAPLAYRGCVAFGEVYVHERVFVGQAIDDAAELSEAAAAAVIWLAPTARAVAEAAEEPSEVAYVPWCLPLRGGGTVDVLAVNPFLHEAIDRIQDDLQEAELSKIEDSLLVPLRKSARLDVVQKFQNTRAFLAVAKAHTLATFGPMQDAYFEEEIRAREEYEANG